MKKVTALFAIISLSLGQNEKKAPKCIPSLTEVSGSHAPTRFCSGNLIFEDNFDTLNFKKWEHERTLAGGGNWEFQWYTNNRSNSFTENGVLKIKPTLTSDHFGEAALTSMMLDINGGEPGIACTNPAFFGCSRTGNPVNIINPIKSAKVRTLNSFSFKYGRLEVCAKLPAGDWLWPAIGLMSRYSAYGLWPTSGLMTLVESRGNRHLQRNGVNIGLQQLDSTLQWGPNTASNAFARTQWTKRNPDGFDRDFHKFELVWTPDSITVKVDNETIGSVAPPEGGFWEFGDFNKTGYENPWRSGTKLAPFDQEFYITINLAVGGINYFPDDAMNPSGKPWTNDSPKAATDFWDGRNQWYLTWNLGINEDAYLKVDYVRVYAL